MINKIQIMLYFLRKIKLNVIRYLNLIGRFNVLYQGIISKFYFIEKTWKGQTCASSLLGLGKIVE